MVAYNRDTNHGNLSKTVWKYHTMITAAQVTKL